MENYSLTDDGFTFLPRIFQAEEIASARYGLWKIINGGTWPEYTLSLSGILADNDVYIKNIQQT